METNRPQPVMDREFTIVLDYVSYSTDYLYNLLESGCSYTTEDLYQTLALTYDHKHDLMLFFKVGIMTFDCLYEYTDFKERLMFVGLKTDKIVIGISIYIDGKYDSTWEFDEDTHATINNYKVLSDRYELESYKELLFLTDVCYADDNRINPFKHNFEELEDV